ncbi:hypothetical protein M5W94_28090, partial [Paenibacillus thiaminolyticus]
GSSIGDDMVHVKEQQMAIRPQLEESRSQERRLTKIKRAHEFPKVSIRFLFLHPYVLHRKCHVPVYPLHRFTADQFKAGPQRLVTANQLAERFL